MPAHQLTPDLDDLPAADPEPSQAWGQADITFTTWADAPRIVHEHLRPGLLDGSWWFIRKHPTWRLRHRHAIPDALARRLDALTATGTLQGWHHAIYEPETHAFGGPAAMNIAHDLFCNDSTTALALTQPGTTPAAGRHAEVSILAISRLLRAARLEPYEQGDVWARVAHLRPDPSASPPPDAAIHTAAMQRLVTLDTGPASPLLRDRPLAPLAGWLAAFTTTGERLADLAHIGELHRGVRGVLAYHVLHHWNRLAIPACHQARLARLARDSLLPPDTGTSP